MFVLSYQVLTLGNAFSTQSILRLVSKWVSSMRFTSSLLLATCLCLVSHLFKRLPDSPIIGRVVVRAHVQFSCKLFSCSSLLSSLLKLAMYSSHCDNFLSRMNCNVKLRSLLSSNFLSRMYCKFKLRSLSVLVSLDLIQSLLGSFRSQFEAK